MPPKRWSFAKQVHFVTDLKPIVCFACPGQRNKPKGDQLLRKAASIEACASRNLSQEFKPTQSKMDRPSAKVIDILAANGVTEIYHANSVLTSTQFLRNASLLSRGHIDRKGLYQTPQSSDALDKKIGIWFEVFTDSVDIHDRASNANLYGPVLFVLGLNRLKSMYRGRLWVTKLNPSKWEGVPDNERWFRCINDLRLNFSVGNFDQMIVFRHSGGELPIKKCLTKIILDDPHLTRTMDDGEEVDVFSMAYGALRSSMTEGRITVPIEKRSCSIGCKCQNKYRNKGILEKMFLPIPVPVP